MHGPSPQSCSPLGAPWGLGWWVGPGLAGLGCTCPNVRSGSALPQPTGCLCVSDKRGSHHSRVTGHTLCLQAWVPICARAPNKQAPGGSGGRYQRPEQDLGPRRPEPGNRSGWAGPGRSEREGGARVGGQGQRRPDLSPIGQLWARPGGPDAHALGLLAAGQGLAGQEGQELVPRLQTPATGTLCLPATCSGACALQTDEQQPLCTHSCALCFSRQPSQATGTRRAAGGAGSLQGWQHCLSSRLGH